eukprot:403346798
MQNAKNWYSPQRDFDKCPGNCCPPLDEQCRRRLDNTGYPYMPEQQMILVFGGITYRNKTFGVNKTSVYDKCEDYYAITGKTTLEDKLKNCGEELLNDMWRYHVQKDLWTPIRYDYNRDTQAQLIIPTTRYGHAGVHIELDDQYTILDVTNGTVLRREFMYIYGGFSFECTTACNDTWRYEIPIGPYSFYPTSKSTWVDVGNFWTKLSVDGTNNPGKRWRHNMIAYQKFKDDYNLFEEHFIFLFGGIQTLNSLEKIAYNQPTGFMYKQDMWRFNLISNQWEEIEQYGISQIIRHIYLWNTTSINQQITTDEMIQDDKKTTNILTKQATNANEIKKYNIQIPSPRSGHSMTLVGNPLEYIMIFGGSTYENVTESGVANVIKKTLDDMWVFYVRSSTWNQVFPNSDMNPEARESSTLVTVKADRLVLLFGGQYAETLFKDVWQYNLNTNMWAKLNVINDVVVKIKNCSSCSNCTKCDTKVFKRINCADCHNCTSPDGPNVYKNLSCEYCGNCVQERYFDCVKCTNCSDCYNSTLAANPDGYKGHTMVATKSGIVIYGGANWVGTNLDETDTIEYQKEKYLEKCRNILQQRSLIEQANSEVLGESYPDLSIDDMGTARWTDQYRKTNNVCFNSKVYPAFPKTERRIIYGEDVFFLSTKDCYLNCSTNGLCALGRCTCKNGYHSSGCELNNCPNSLCFVDIDTIDPQQCYHCSSNGRCNNGTCQCTEGYFGSDCSLKGCQNNCSNTATHTYGTCVQDFPMGYCRCNEWMKRGGDDCSYIFCLNDCSGRGQCKSGKCICDANFFGEDCSVNVVNIMSGVMMRIVLAFVVSASVLGLIV